MYDEANFIPLRGVNAVAFCPRLFWFEYVAHEFEHDSVVAVGLPYTRQRPDTIVF